MRWIKFTLKFVLGSITLLSLAIAVFVNFAPTFGAAPSGAALKRIQASSHYAKDQFQNLVPTKLDTSSPENPRSIPDFFFPPEDKNPQKPLPSEKFDSTKLTPGKFVWLGHSTILFNHQGTIVLTDPIFHRASPVPFVGEPFAMRYAPQWDALPPIDVVLLSHDHYDHLDHLAIAALAPTTKKFLMPLGLGAHLRHWGVPDSKIQEFDWYEKTQWAGIDFTLTPSRHFSGRGLFNRFSTLWGSWVVKSDSLSLFFSGDSGYFSEFAKIGQRYGPFDMAFIENGAYNNAWAQVHMKPEEAVQASVDLKAQVMFPIHWGKFDLSIHPWNEPIIRAKAAAQTLQVNVATPLVGEVFGLDAVPERTWW